MRRYIGAPYEAHAVGASIWYSPGIEPGSRAGLILKPLKARLHLTMIRLARTMRTPRRRPETVMSAATSARTFLTKASRNRTSRRGQRFQYLSRRTALQIWGGGYQPRSPSCFPISPASRVLPPAMRPQGSVAERTCFCRLSSRVEVLGTRTRRVLLAVQRGG